MVLRGIGGSDSESRRGPKSVSVSGARAWGRCGSSSGAVTWTRLWSRSISLRGLRSCSASGFRIVSVSLVGRFA